jgi:putative ABC transport system permease protein
MRLGEAEVQGIAQFAVTNLPVLMVLIIACLSVGTLIYARTATREGEIAVRFALGASRGRIMSQLFVEALVLASIAAAVGLIAADRVLTWGIESVGDAPFWFTPGLTLTTIAYAGGLALVSAAMLSFLPALKVTRSRVQPHLANLGTGGATLRFGRVWTGAMIAQVALTAIGIPIAMETASQVMRKVNIRAEFPSREYLAAVVDLEEPFEEEATPVFEARRAQAFAALEQRVAQEPGFVAMTFADRAPGSLLASRRAEVEISPGARLRQGYGGQAGSTFEWIGTAAVGPEFFEILDRPMVIGRAFHSGDRSPAARTVIVNEAFVRGFRSRGGSASPIGARLRYADRSAFAADTSADQWFEIVGVVRDVGLNPGDDGNEAECVFHPASAGTVPALVMSVRMRGNPGTLAARLPIIAAEVDARLHVRDARPLTEWIRERDLSLTMQAGALTGVTLLVLFLSALGMFSLVSVSVSRRTREIGLRSALGANPRHVLGGILSRAVVLMGSGITAGGALLLLSLALGLGPSGQPAGDIALFAGYLGMTSAVMLAACLLACIAPARRVLRINPTEALREV